MNGGCVRNRTHSLHSTNGSNLAFIHLLQVPGSLEGGCEETYSKSVYEHSFWNFLLTSHPVLSIPNQYKSISGTTQVFLEATLEYAPQGRSSLCTCKSSAVEIHVSDHGPIKLPWISCGGYLPRQFKCFSALHLCFFYVLCKTAWIALLLKCASVYEYTFFTSAVR